MTDRVVERWPALAEELRAALVAEAELALAETVGELVCVQECECSDAFCQSFYSAPPPPGAWGPGHRNVWLELPSGAGMLVLDVVGESITYVEVLHRPKPLD